VPSPWLVYVVVAGLFSTILLFLSVRLLRPQPEGRRRAQGRRAAEA
jgi:hypothetical protein